MATTRERESDPLDQATGLPEIGLEMTRDFLAERGVEPDATGAYPPEALLEAIRARGWEPVLTGQPGAWRVDVAEWQGAERVLRPAAEGTDLATTLRDALWEAMGWLTRDQARALFDADARRAFGISGDEFLRRYDAGELDYDDPSVIHLAMIDSFGR